MLASIIYNHGKFCDDFKSTLKLGAYAQAKGKALETPESNAIIGEWIRHKLGVPDGTYITKQMLDQYGKTKVLFKKYEDGIYTLEY